jgi:phosphatidylserine/phosphatidylglycerophosphate/cardiolipin synthase-like enzyme
MLISFNTTLNRRSVAGFFLAACLAVVGVAWAGYEAGVWRVEHQFRVFYSLDARQNDRQIISVINSARQYVYFAIYTFTLPDIADALIRAKERGVAVWGITDASQTALEPQTDLVQKLQAAGIPVETQKHQDGIMHIKAVVTENQYAIGSYNWTEAATVANDELLEVGSNSYVRRQYLNTIQRVLLINK